MPDLASQVRDKLIFKAQSRQQRGQIRRVNRLDQFDSKKNAVKQSLRMSADTP
jgi:hypothetical protein